MHFNDFVKVIKEEIRVMSSTRKDLYFTFYDMDNGALIYCTMLSATSLGGEESCIFKINNFEDDNFEVVFNDGCGELLLEDFESQPCNDGAATALAVRIFETTVEM